MSSGKVIVAGAGLMGTGIAHAFASSGFATILIDSGEGVAARSSTSIGALFDEGVARGKMTAAEAEAPSSRLTTAVSVEGRRARVGCVRTCRFCGLPVHEQQKE